MTVAALLRSVVAALDGAGIPFMLTGSLAAAYHGAGRATMDVDLIIHPTAAQLRSLVRALEGSGVYVSRAAADEALAARSRTPLGCFGFRPSDWTGGTSSGGSRSSV